MFGALKAARQKFDDVMRVIDRKTVDWGRCEKCGHAADDAPVMNLDDEELNDYCLCSDPHCICNPLANPADHGRET